MRPSDPPIPGDAVPPAGLVTGENFLLMKFPIKFGETARQQLRRLFAPKWGIEAQNWEFLLSINVDFYLKNWIAGMVFPFSIHYDKFQDTHLW